MRPVALCKKINDFLVDGFAQGIFLSFQYHSIGGPNEHQVISPTVSPPMLSDGGVGIQEFIELLDTDAYSVVFGDGAILSMQCRFNGDVISAHRYVYTPCPIAEELIRSRPDEIALADWLRELPGNTLQQSFRSRGTLRFDFAPVPTPPPVDPHPVSHLTIGSQSCRIPVRSPLSPADIFGLIFQNFYREHLANWVDVAPHLRCQSPGDTITKNEQSQQHIHWLT